MNDKVIQAKQKRKAKAREAEKEHREAIKSLGIAVASLKTSIEQIDQKEVDLSPVTNAVEALSKSVGAYVDQTKKEKSALLEAFKQHTASLVKSIPQPAKLIPVAKEKTVVTSPTQVKLPQARPVQGLADNPRRKEAFIFNNSTFPVSFGFDSDLSLSTSAGIIPPGKTYIEDVHTGPIYLWTATVGGKATVYEVSSE